MTFTHIEHYAIRTDMHLGPLRRQLHADSVIEWEPATERMRINGVRIEEGNGVEPAEAMRQLRVLSQRHPDNPPIVPLTESQCESEEPTAMNTSTLCVLPILGCLVAAEQYLDDKNITAKFEGVTDQQRDFLDSFQDLMDGASHIDELESIADEHKQVNAWLQERGLELPLTSSFDAFAVASVLNILLSWLYKGSKTSITGADNTAYTGVHIKDGVIVGHAPALHPHPVVRVSTQSGDTVCMSMIDDAPKGFEGLFLKAADLERVKATSHSYQGVCFPMIDLDIQPDISWMEGMQVGGDYRIECAIQQTRFRMNEEGAKTESTAAATICRAMARPHILDRPFLLWIQRDGMKFPVFAALLCEDVWKEPKPL